MVLVRDFLPHCASEWNISFCDVQLRRGPDPPDVDLVLRGETIVQIEVTSPANGDPTGTARLICRSDERQDGVLPSVWTTDEQEWGIVDDTIKAKLRKLSCVAWHVGVKRVLLVVICARGRTSGKMWAKWFAPTLIEDYKPPTIETSAVDEIWLYDDGQDIARRLY